ncbi:helix-turn-helix domain-containing protein [Pseudobacillus badius]|uniref:helix-turn-helix domain-containing protein n=1 Tax=Bacillus badius TaxID=1455 RepID=UPI003CE9998C
MKKLGELLKSLRGKESLRDASKRIGISHTYLDTIEKGYDKRSGKPVKPTPDTLKLIAKAYDYSYEELMKIAGYIEENDKKHKPMLTEKDERDIAKRMNKIKKDLIEAKPDGDGLNFMGEPMSEEAIESLLEALEHAERIATLANKKYTPKKYRDED